MEMLSNNTLSIDVVALRGLLEIYPIYTKFIQMGQNKRVLIKSFLIDGRVYVKFINLLYDGEDSFSIEKITEMFLD